MLAYNCPEMVGTRRRYNLKKRARSAEETRVRIIEAARTLLRESSYADASLDRIAAEAGVSRQTIYAQFGSKRGVLQALVEHIERESYGVGIKEGLEGIHDPVYTLHNSIRHQANFFERNADLLRTFYAQAVSDPDFRAVWEDRLQERWDALNWLVEMLAREGKLAGGWTAKDATDWLWSLTGFRLYEELVIKRGWNAVQLTRHGIQAISMVLADRDLPGDS
jgi:AcrR family transcriptional regulator